MSLEQAKGMNDHVTRLAKQVGLVYNFDTSIVANSFNAHRFTHFAKQFGKQNEAEELLFRSYFTDGKNIDDYPTLIQLGEKVGLDTTALKNALENGSYTDDVKADIYEARRIGVHGVPFFVFNRKHAVSRAQENRTFWKHLKKLLMGGDMPIPKLNRKPIYSQWHKTLTASYLSKLLFLKSANSIAFSRYILLTCFSPLTSLMRLNP